jgi:fucose permease
MSNDVRILRLCSVGMIAVAYGPSLIPIYLTTFSESFGGLSESELGRIPAALFLGAMAAIVVSGPLADRFGAKTFAVGGSILLSFGFVVLTTARSYEFLLLAAVVTGLGTGVLDMIMSPIVSALHVGNRSRALNRLHAFYCFGAVGAIAAATAGIQLGIRWQTVVLALTTLPVVVAIAFLLVSLPQMVHPDHQRQGLRELMRSRRFYAGILAIALVGATEAGMAQWLPAYAERELGYTKTTAGAALLFFSIGMGVGRLAGERVVERVGSHRLVLFAGLFCAAMFVLGALVPVRAIALAACTLVGLGCSVLWPTNLGIAADRMPHGGATLFAFMAASGSLGNAVAPWIEGIVADRSNLTAAILVGAAFPLALALVVWFIQRDDDRALRLDRS